jgi:hypothetical protein
MHTISTNVRKERGYFTGVVAYWRRREVWVFQRSFISEAKTREWLAIKRAALELAGPAQLQAAE